MNPKILLTDIAIAPISQNSWLIIPGVFVFDNVIHPLHKFFFPIQQLTSMFTFPFKENNAFVDQRRQ